MAFVKGNCVSSHEATHDLAQRCLTGAEEEVKMVWNQGPRVALRLGFFKDSCKAVEEGFAVLIVLEDFPSFNSPGHHMLQEAGGVESGLAGHDLFIKNICGQIKLLYHILKCIWPQRNRLSVT